jgi:hypothetical protein
VTSFPIVLVGSRFWGPLADWLRNTLIAEGMISPEDMDLIQITDTAEEAVDLVLAGLRGDTEERRGGMFGSAPEEDEEVWSPEKADGE